MEKSGAKKFADFTRGFAVSHLSFQDLPQKLMTA